MLFYANNTIEKAHSQTHTYTQKEKKNKRKTDTVLLNANTKSF